MFTPQQGQTVLPGQTRFRDRLNTPCLGNRLPEQARNQ